MIFAKQFGDLLLYENIMDLTVKSEIASDDDSYVNDVFDEATDDCEDSDDQENVSEHFRSDDEPFNPQQSPERFFNYKVREQPNRFAVNEKSKKRKEDILKTIMADERFKQALDQFVSETTNTRSKNLSAISNDNDQMTALVNSFDKFKRFLNRCNKINFSLQQAA